MNDNTKYEEEDLPQNVKRVKIGNIQALEIKAGNGVMYTVVCLPDEVVKEKSENNESSAS